MDQFDFSIFGIRLRARGQLGILGAVAVMALLLAYALTA
jgi:hypothetical protein